MVTVNKEGNALEAMGPCRIQTFIEDFVRPANSMNETTARATLAAGQFIEALRPIRRMALTRRPVIRTDGRLELLPNGYDSQTETLTSCNCEIDESMSFEKATETVRDLYKDTCFLDWERGLATAVAGTLTLYCAELLKPSSPRPIFVIQGNTTGSGKGTVAAMSIAPIFGEVVIGTASQKEEEIKKALLPVVMSGKDYVLLDNLKGKLDSPSLEAFTTAQIYEDRILGSSKLVRGRNLSTVFITGNALRISPDLARRALTIGLFMSEENADTVGKIKRRWMYRPFSKRGQRFYRR